MMMIPTRTNIVLSKVQKSALSRSMMSAPMMKAPTTVPTGSPTAPADHRQPVQKAACALSGRPSTRCTEPQLRLRASKPSPRVSAEYVSLKKEQREQQRKAVGSNRAGVMRCAGEKEHSCG